MTESLFEVFIKQDKQLTYSCFPRSLFNKQDGLIKCELLTQKFSASKESKTNSTLVKAIIAAESRSKLNVVTATTTILKSLNSTNSIHPITKQTIS